MRSESGFASVLPLTCCRSFTSFGATVTGGEAGATNPSQVTHLTPTVQRRFIIPGQPDLHVSELVGNQSGQGTPPIPLSLPLHHPAALFMSTEKHSLLVKETSGYNLFQSTHNDVVMLLPVCVCVFFFCLLWYSYSICLKMPLTLICICVCLGVCVWSPALSPLQ